MYFLRSHLETFQNLRNVLKRFMSNNPSWKRLISAKNIRSTTSFLGIIPHRVTYTRKVQSSLELMTSLSPRTRETCHCPASAAPCLAPNMPSIRQIKIMGTAALLNPLLTVGNSGPSPTCPRSLITQKRCSVCAAVFCSYTFSNINLTSSLKIWRRSVGNFAEL